MVEVERDKWTQSSSRVLRAKQGEGARASPVYSRNTIDREEVGRGPDFSIGQ